MARRSPELPFVSKGLCPKVGFAVKTPFFSELPAHVVLTVALESEVVVEEFVVPRVLGTLTLSVLDAPLWSISKLRDVLLLPGRKDVYVLRRSCLVTCIVITDCSRRKSKLLL